MQRVIDHNVIMLIIIISFYNLPLFTDCEVTMRLVRSLQRVVHPCLTKSPGQNRPRRICLEIWAILSDLHIASVTMRAIRPVARNFQRKFFLVKKGTKVYSV